MKLPKLFRSKAQAGSNTGGYRASDADNWIPANGFGGGRRSVSGIYVSEEEAKFNAAAFGAQRAIAESIAILPRDIYRKSDKGTRQAVSNHPSERMLTLEANPLMTSFRFFSTLLHHALSYGNGYAELTFRRGGSGQVVELWPIPAPRVTPEIVTTNQGVRLQYKIKTDTEPLILSQEKVLHIPGLGFDGVRGYPLIQLMLDTLGLSKAVEDYGALYFKQGAQLPGYVTIPDTFTEEQVKNARRHVEINNSGLENAHRIKFLYESAKFNPSGSTPNDSQMVLSKVFQIHEICRWYRIPPHKLQELTNAPGYNSLEMFNTEFVADTLMPWIVLLEQELNRKIFQDGLDAKTYVKFNANALLRGDSATRANYYRTMVMSRIMTTNEVRALEDLPPIEGGDELLTPLNMSSISDRQMDSQQRGQD